MQIASALSYLHDLLPPIFHGAMKAVSIFWHSFINYSEPVSENFQSHILINEKFEASLTDLSLWHTLGTSAYTKNGISSYVRWMACELLPTCTTEEFNPKATAATDIWSFAMTVVEVRV
jgi:hypothetical protein